MMRIFSVMYLPNDDHIFLSGGWDDTMQVRNSTIIPIQPDFRALNLSYGDKRGRVSRFALLLSSMCVCQKPT